jgi:hypothetical protein
MKHVTLLSLFALGLSGCFQTRYVEVVPREFAPAYDATSDALPAMPVARRLAAQQSQLGALKAWPTGKWELVRHPKSGLLLERRFDFEYAGELSPGSCGVGRASLTQERVGEQWAPEKIGAPIWGRMRPDDAFPDLQRDNAAVPFSPFTTTYKAVKTVGALKRVDCAALASLPNAG